MPFSPLPAALVFDMDGLLLDTERLYCACWRAAAAELGLDLAEELILGMVGLRHDDSLALLRRQLSQAAVEALDAGTRQHYRRRLETEVPPVKAGAPELLLEARARQLPCVVGTSTATSAARHKLERAGLLAFFAEVVGGDRVARGKPAPDVYLAAARSIAAEPATCLVFEDSFPGIEAGLAAGMRVCMVPDLLAPPADLAARGVHCLPSLHAALDSLRAATEVSNRRQAVTDR